MNGNQSTNVQFLQGISNGQFPSTGASCPQPVQLVAPSGNCSSPQEIRATSPSAGIDPLALLNQKCGTTSFPFTNNATGSALARWELAGCARETAPFVNNDGTPLSIDSPNFISTGFPFTEVGSGANDARTEAFDCIAEGLGSIVSSVTLRTTDAGLDLMSNAQLVEFTVNPWDNFSVCREEIDQNNCSPCITTNGNNPVIEWNTGLVAISGVSGLYVDVPAGVTGKFQVCFASRAIQTMVPCGSVPINCVAQY